MDTLKDKHILVTGGGAPGAAGIIAALRKEQGLKISSCDVHDDVAGRILTDEFFRLPFGDHPDYTKVLLKECIARKIDLVFPITTRELIPLSQAKASFKKQGIKILVSETKSLSIANNKCDLYKHLYNTGLNVPKHAVVVDIDEFLMALNYLDADQNTLIFKPCSSNGSRGFRILKPVVDEADILFNQKPNAAYMTKEKAIDILSKNPFPPLLVSEYLPGDEYSVDCLLQNGEMRCIIPRKRLKMNNGISVEGLIEYNEEVIAYCRSLLQSLHLHGCIGVQVKYDQKNKPLVLELNPRIQGSSVACIGAGINLPLLAVKQEFGIDIGEATDPDQIKWNTHFVRHYQELFFS